MNEYCEKHRSNELCALTNRTVTANFCKLVCKQRPEMYAVKSLEQRREGMRKPLTESERGNRELVSVIIPCGLADEQYIERTTKSLEENAAGPIEILVGRDEHSKGHSYISNQLAEKAKGKYLYRLDAHCGMSPEWDQRLKASCGPKTVVVPMIDGLNLTTWKGTGRDTGLLIANQFMRNIRPLKWKELENRDIEEETMSMKACCFLVQTDYYWDRKGHEDTGDGHAGAEWMFKVWLTGGRMLVRTDVVCYHLLRETPYTPDRNKQNECIIEVARRWRDGQGDGQTRPIEWLLDKFKEYLDPEICHVPSRLISNYG